MSGLTILSFGGGQDSSAILAKLIEDDELYNRYVGDDELLVVMSDTGDEHPATYFHVESVREICEEHGIDFRLIEAGSKFHLDSWQNLIDPQIRNGDSEFQPTMVQRGTKSCTHNLKLYPIYKFVDEWINERFDYGYKTYDSGGCRKNALKRLYEEHGRIDVLLGYASGEEDRKEASLEIEEKEQDGEFAVWKQALRRRFPLIEEGLDRQDCQRINREFYDYRVWPSNCMRCPYQSDAEILWLDQEHPDLIEQWLEIEERKIDRDDAETNHGVFGEEESLADRLERVREELGDLSDEELFERKFSHGCPTNNF